MGWKDRQRKQQAKRQRIKKHGRSLKRLLEHLERRAKEAQKPN